MQKCGAFLSTLGFWILVVCLLLTAVDIACFDRAFYQSEYEKLNTARSIGMTKDTLTEVTDKLLSYTAGELDSLKFKAKIGGKSTTVFGQREREHMVDVKNLYLTARTVRNFGLLAAAALLLLAFACTRRDKLLAFAKSYLRGCLAVGIVVGAVGLWAAIDFDGFWTSFHRLFFTNELWLLDPATDVLIQMVPGQFFYDLVMRIVGLVALLAGLPLAVSAAYCLYRRHRRRTLLSIGPEEPKEPEEWAEYEPAYDPEGGVGYAPQAPGAPENEKAPIAQKEEPY